MQCLCTGLSHLSIQSLGQSPGSFLQGGAAPGSSLSPQSRHVSPKWPEIVNPMTTLDSFLLMPRDTQVAPDRGSWPTLPPARTSPGSGLPGCSLVGVRTRLRTAAPASAAAPCRGADSLLTLGRLEGRGSSPFTKPVVPGESCLSGFPLSGSGSIHFTNTFGAPLGVPVLGTW